MAQYSPTYPGLTALHPDAICPLPAALIPSRDALCSPVQALRSASAKLRFNRHRRALRRNFRSWRAAYRSREQYDGRRRLALRAALRSSAHRDLSEAVSAWRVSVATWQGTWYATTGGETLQTLRGAEAARDEARGLRAELDEEQARILLVLYEW